MSNKDDLLQWICPRSVAINSPQANHLSLVNYHLSVHSSLLSCLIHSCGFIFDENLGFKKKYPPGTKFSSIPSFNCPVCGASKNQFEVKRDESEGGNPIPEGDFDPDGKIGKTLDVGTMGQ